MGSWYPNCLQLESPPVPWSGLLHTWGIGNSELLVRVNYLKLYVSLSVFHKEASWDRYCSLFSYINELPAVIEHSEVSFYADDTVLYCFSNEPHLLESKLNADFCNVATWLQANKLTLNPTKTKSMLIGSNRKLANISSMSLSRFDCNLDSVNTF